MSSMMILYALGGAALIAIAFAFTKYSRFAVVALVPIALAGWFVYQTKIPDWLGYPISIDFIPKKQQMTMLHGIKGKDWIYLLIVTAEDPRPRLIQMPNNEGNSEQFDKLMEQMESGNPVIEVSGEGGSGDQNGTGEQSQSDVKGVPIERQQILKK